MSSIIVSTYLQLSGYQSIATRIENDFGVNPIPKSLPHTNHIKNINLLKAWLDLLNSTYMTNRIEKIREDDPNYFPDIESFYSILLQSYPAPAEYLDIIERFFCEIADSTIPDGYLPFVTPHKKSCYRHILSNFAKKGLKFAPNTMNPFVVNLVCNFSSGYQVVDNERVPTIDTLEFVEKELIAIEKDQILIKAFAESRDDYYRAELIMSNFTPTNAPERKPEWSQDFHDAYMAHIQALLIVYDANPSALQG